MRVCHGFCVEVGVKCSKHVRPYSNGLKYCSQCDLFICSIDRLCFCCASNLRSSRRTSEAIKRKEVFRY